MKHKILRTLASLLAVWLLACPALAMSFPDVDENAAYAEAIDYLSDIGIFSGDDKGNFNPDKTVTRAEMAAIICRMLGETENSPSSTAFTDVPVGHWANAYVAKVSELGIVNGYGNGLFGPSDPVTYEQAVTMVVRAVGHNDDAESMGGYPNGFLSFAENAGFLSGINSKIGEAFSRANIAMLLLNYYNYNM